MLNKSRNWVIFFIAMFLLIFGVSLYLLNNSRVAEQRVRLQKETELNKRTNELFEKEKAIADLNREKKEIEDMLMARQKELEAVKADLARLEARYDADLSGLGELQAQNRQLLDQLNQSRGGIKEMEQKIQALQADKTALTAKLGQLEGAVGQRLMQSDVEESPDKIETNARLLESGDTVKLGKIIVQKNSGQVVRVRDINGVYGFVVIDAGSREGLAKESIINVIRDKRLIARAVIEQVKENSAAAIILPEWTRDEIRVGDVVSRF